MEKHRLSSEQIIAEATRVLSLEGKAILDCSDRLRQNAGGAAESFQKAVGICMKALDDGGKLIVTGVGKSGKVGQKIAATLSSTGSLSLFLHPTEGLHGDLGVVRSSDVVLALSYTGNTDEVIKLLPSLKSLGVKVIGLGGKANSLLAQQCDVWLDGGVGSEACPHNLAPTTSTTLALALGDALAVTLMNLRGFDVQAFALNHPGGSLGKRLQLRVEGLMHRGSDVPVLSVDAKMDEVILISSQKPLGGVLIVEGTRLKGIITDGDLRRSLKLREKFFDLRAEEVMTRNPITVGPEMKAEQALDLMENRPSQISVLPVVDSSGNWMGLLRLHDLVRAF